MQAAAQAEELLQETVLLQEVLLTAHMAKAYDFPLMVSPTLMGTTLACSLLSLRLRLQLYSLHSCLCIAIDEAHMQMNAPTCASTYVTDRADKAMWYECTQNCCNHVTYCCSYDACAKIEASCICCASLFV